MCLLYLYFVFWFAFGVDRNHQITASWKILKTLGKMWKIPMMKAVPLLVSEGESEAAAVVRPPQNQSLT